MTSALLATHPISQAEPGRATDRNLLQAMVAPGSSPVFLPVILALSWVGGSQQRKGRLGTVRMKIIAKTTIFALLWSFGLGDEQKEVVEKDDQLLRFTIPLGFGAGQLLEEDDPALR